MIVLPKQLQNMKNSKDSKKTVIIDMEKPESIYSISYDRIF